MKIRSKINVHFLAGFVFVYCLTGLIVGIYTTNLIKQNIYSHFLLNSRIRAEHIRTYIQEQEKISIILAAASVYRDFLKEPENSSQYPVIKGKIDKRLIRTLEADSQLYELFILDANGKIVASSNRSQEGGDKSQDDYFIKAKDSKVFLKDIYFSSTTNKLGYTISSPVNDEDGTLLGVSVLRYLPDIFFSIAKSENVLNKTEESFLINKDKFFITPSLFLGKDVILKQKVETENTKNCFDPKEIEYVKKNGYFGLNDFFSTQLIETKDYRNVNVIATHAYIPETGWCLITKADKVDLLSFRSVLIMTFIFVFIIAGLIFLLISLMISKMIIKPISVLITGAKKIKEGNFDFKIDIKTKDEAGELADAFNQMAVSIKQNRIELQQYSKGLEDMVTEKTKELQNKINDLNETREAVLNVAEDAEEEKQKNIREKDKIDAILHSIGDGVFVVDSNLKVILVNEVAAKMTGYTMEEILGTRYTDKLKFIFEDTGKINDQFINKAIETKVTQDMSNHTVLIDKTGNKIQVADSTAPLLDKDGEVIGCVVVFRDVTHERAIDKAKTEFVSLASHQLRTPLSTIGWYSEMLLSGDAGKLKEEQKKYLEEIYKGNQRMVDLVNALLNVSRLELGTFLVEPELIDIIKLMKNVIDEQKPQIKAKKMKLTESHDDKLPMFNADPKLLHIVFQNLLSNSVKYTPDKGKVDINMHIMKRGESVNNRKLKEDSMVITISDTGYGIPKMQQDKIFTKLFRADNVGEKDTEGTGLGLYIVKAIIDQSGGAIWFESEENKGTIFYVVLPLSGMKKREGTKTLT